MTENPVVVTYQVHATRRRHAIVLADGPSPLAIGKVPRVARLLALAHHFERLLDQGVVDSQAELAALAGVTRPRVTQILNLLLLVRVTLRRDHRERSRVITENSPPDHPQRPAMLGSRQGSASPNPFGFCALDPALRVAGLADYGD